MPHAYTEDQLVKQPVIGLFAALDWTTVSAMEEVFGANHEVVLGLRVRAALDRLNLTLPPWMN